MSISFSEKYAIDSETLGVTFQAIVNGQSICCRVTQEALQDIEPNGAQDNPELQFMSNI